MAGRYATALFELALDARKLKQVEKEFGSFIAMLDSSADLRRLVRSPVYSSEAQARALAAILAKARIKGLMASFLGLITNNRRLFAVRDIARAFQALAARHRGETAAEVATASKLSAAQLKRLKTTLKSMLGQDVAVTASVDPALLGGLVVKMGSRMIDNSLKTKLDNLKVAMKEVG
jgi:F-type H+-transporting ATPase subunit delta